jgi:hypothetical protein
MASDAMSNGFVLYLTLTETSTNPAANTSVVSYSLYINPPGNYQSFNLNSGDQSYSITINGSVVASGGFTYDFRSPNENTNKVIKSGTVTITHNANGSKTVAASGYANTASSTVGDGSIASFNTVLTDFAVLPEAPEAPTVIRTGNGTDIQVISSVPFSVATITNYEMRKSSDGTTFAAAESMGSDGVLDETITATLTRYYQTRAISSEGTGAWSPSTYSGGIPSAPASIALSRNARDVTVTLGASVINGSYGTTYYVKYSTDGGTTYSTPVEYVAGGYTYTNLTAGLTYIFAGYAVNSVGFSENTTDTLFVPAGGKRYDGSAWISTATAKRYDGSVWQSLTTAKRYNGSTWVDLS